VTDDTLDDQTQKRMPAAPVGVQIQIRDYSWRPFGRREPIFSALNLDIEPGERVLLAGPSGSGKSTLLRALAGVLETTESGERSGSIHIDGIEASPGETNAGLLVQDPTDATVAGLVGRDVAFGLENLGTAPASIWAAVHAALDSVSFPYGVDHDVHQVSGGEAQRLALAGVLVMRPGLLLLDEPTSMLDPVAAATVRNAIETVIESTGATVVVVEHQVEAWLPLVDRVVVLSREGSIVADGPAGETLAAHSTDLAAQGVWVPGAPTPAPLRIPDGLCSPSLMPAAVGAVLLTAESIALVRRTRAALGTSTRPAASRATASRDIFTGLTLELRAGEILAVVGPSGAGKSSLTAILAGLSAPTSGTVLAAESLRAGAEGSPVRWRGTELARRIGWVPQQAELAVVGRTVLEDVLLTSGRLGLDASATAGRARGLLAVLGLDSVIGSDPHELSGGETRRLALAAAVAHGPAILVLDEPTVGQDRTTWAAVAGVILAARDAGVAVVVATHDPLLVELADSVIALGATASPAIPDTPGEDPPPTGDAPGSPARTADPGLHSATGRPSARRPRRWPRRGLAERCGPLSLLAAGLLLLIGALFIRDLGQAAIAVGLELLLAPLILGWRRVPLRRLAPGLLAVASIAFSTWLLSVDQSIVTGATAGLRIAFFVLPGVLLASMIDPSALGDHLAQRLRLPGRPVVAGTAALQQFETLAEQWHQLQVSRRIRGVDSGRGPLARAAQLGSLTFALLVQSLLKAGRMAVAMEARGFSATLTEGRRRTWARAAPWTPADTLLTLTAATLAALTALLPLLLP
jgi:energy-coupling factor transporter ATP-binding protein EcfA2/energy-coupling factor transporter transmembrane protein EcfT